MTEVAAPRSRRLISWLWDYLIIIAWLAVLFLITGVPQILGWFDLTSVWENQLYSDLAITGLTVLPYFLYLVLTEGGPTHATWGKRRAGISVVEDDGSPPSTNGIVTRNLVKVLPWQLAHMGTLRLIYDGNLGLPIGLNVASMVLAAAIVLPILIGRRGIHDVLGSTTVVSAVAGSNEPATSPS